MTVIEIIFAILLILSCVFIIAVVLMQESKQGMSNVISGGSADNYFQKNSGRTKEAKLAKATKIAAVIVFVVAIAVNLISVYWGGSSDTTPTTMTETQSVVFDTTAAEGDAEAEAEVTDAADETAAETAAETAEDTTAETTAAAE